jgi:predicted enzyme related to lactoylglutathione lyase
MRKFVSRIFLFFLLALANVSWAPAQDSGDAWVDSVGTPLYFAIRVGDVDRSVAWYQSCFGLRKLGGSEAEDGSWRIENLGNDRLLVEIIRDRRSEESRRPLGLAKVGFFVPDVEEVADRIEETTGVRPEIVDFELLGQRILQVKDPEGTTLQLFSPLDTPSPIR